MSKNNKPLLKLKVCAKCKLAKPYSEYHKHKINPDGLKYTCKLCRSKEAKEKRLILRKLVLKYYGNKCECCGEDKFEFLALDHINGGGGKHRKEIGGDITLWLIRHNFPEGFRILCHNCNQALGCYGYCPHNTQTTNQN